MLQQFVMRQAIALVVSVVTRLIQKHHETFDPEKARTLVHERIRDLIPPALWGEEVFEDKVIALSDWMMDRMCQAIDGGSSLAEGVLTGLLNQDFEAAKESVRGWFLGLIGIAKGGGSSVDEKSFSESVMNIYNQQEGEDMKKSNDPGVNVLGAQQQQGEIANASEEMDPGQVEAAQEEQENNPQVQQAEQSAQQAAEEAAKATQEPESSEEQAQKQQPSADGK